MSAITDHLVLADAGLLTSHEMSTAKACSRHRRQRDVQICKPLAHLITQRSDAHVSVDRSLYHCRSRRATRARLT
ncbi:hypothetical protein E5Q_01865 [Mixia osmundae IAM 14324]|uniref:Uncharacterized protein n=1 Tax=Mixia osmundae (strain CBS 9802 / IAM 14324 / JCM 22182 / KY 12970) TaxID=764103 RepID=G7DX99_MIXOS|nr:hypothetical protein E5Q_01865 [Mixia osmundae IAM 14324]